MPKRRRARSNLYQVDFIAALFGAFLLLWISKPTGSTGETETAVVVMESSCSDGGSFLPEEAKRCVSNDILQLADASLKLQSCDFELTNPAKRYAFTPNSFFSSLARFQFSSSAKSRADLVKFFGLAIVSSAAGGNRFLAIGYGSSTPPSQLSGASYVGWIAGALCQQDSCSYFNYDQMVIPVKVQCRIHLYSRAWPETCLTATFQTGDPASSFPLKSCRS